MGLFSKKMKTMPVADADRVTQDLSSFNLIKNVTPSLLSIWIEQFLSGHLRSLSVFGEDIIARDDKLKSVESKRRASVSRLGWDIVQFEDSPEAAAQKAELEHFYGSLTATSAVNEDEEGGVNLLIRQMLHSVTFLWSVHDVVWQPSAEGLSGQFRHVPLHFFEHKTSRLRYLETSSSTYGVDLNPGEWLVTCGPGLLIAASILWLYKHSPLKDWLIYSRRYVVPGLIGTTDATQGSDEWNNLKNALAKFTQAWSIVKNTGADVDTIEMSSKAELPWPKLIERCDRAMAILYRGQDLSTMSSGEGEGTGASLQGGEADILLDDDIEVVEETLARKITPFVIRYTRGHDRVLCAFKLNRPNRDNVKLELDIDEKLISWGAPRAKNDLLEKYNRPLPDDGEELATPAQGGGSAAGLLNSSSGDGIFTLLHTSTEQRANVAHEALVEASSILAAKSDRDDMRPLAERLYGILELIENDSMSAAVSALRELQKDLPDMLPGMDSKLVDALYKAVSPGLLNGWAEGIAEREDADV